MSEDVDPTSAADEAPATYPTFIVCTVSSTSVDLPETFARMTLSEAEFPFRSVTIPVAIPDAAAVVAAITGPRAPRPSSQDLLATVLARLTVDVVAARITAQADGVFLAELDLVGPKGRHVVECRPTDAVNAALRHPGMAPILVDERLLGGGALA